MEKKPNTHNTHVHQFEIVETGTLSFYAGEIIDTRRLDYVCIICGEHAPAETETETELIEFEIPV